MRNALSVRLKQSKFSDAGQEAMLSVLVAASLLNDSMDKLCARHGITRAQYNLLRILRGAYPEGHSRCEIAERLVDRAPDVTRLVDRLEAQRLVKRSRGRNDQRQAITAITSRGLKLLREMEPAVAANLHRSRAGLSDKECEELSRLCAEVITQHLPSPTRGESKKKPSRQGGLSG